MKEHKKGQSDFVCGPYSDILSLIESLNSPEYSVILYFQLEGLLETDAVCLFTKAHSVSCSGLVQSSMEYR